MMRIIGRQNIGRLKSNAIPAMGMASLMFHVAIYFQRNAKIASGKKQRQRLWKLTNNYYI
jgi:hypothetical protein